VVSGEPVVIVASSESALKSSPVRRTLEDRLVDDLRSALSKAGFSSFSIDKHAARVVIRGIEDTAAAARYCARVFGVAYAAPATLLPASMGEVSTAVAQVAEESLKIGQSFAIRAHRSSPSPLSRRDVEVQGGSQVLQVLKNRNLKVDLKHPDVTVLVDLAGDRAYVYRSKLSGPGGLPLSSKWKMLAILDSGPLSILAAYAMMRRGCLVELLVPTSQKWTIFDKGRQLHYAKILGELVARPNYKAFLLNIDSPLSVFKDLGNAKCRHLTRALGIQLATQKRFRGIVFSDVVGEITSEQQMQGTTKALPVFTPLIGMNKGDLMELSALMGIGKEELLQQLGLEEASQAVTDRLPESVSLSEGAISDFVF
jgi:thiamine biosynthesis protein ThiI